jgi:hypothetical protein
MEDAGRGLAAKVAAGRAGLGDSAADTAMMEDVGRGYASQRRRRTGPVAPA